MAITTLAGVISNLVRPQHFTKAPINSDGDGPHDLLSPLSFWGGSGFPKAGAWDTTLNGVTLSGTSSNVTGQIPYTDPASGNGYIAGVRATCTMVNSGAVENGGGGQLLICDRLWHNQVANTGTSAQSITTPTWPARDVTGSTNGDGIFIGLECSSGNLLSGTSTIGYTNSSGTASRTSTAVAASAVISGQAYEYLLQAGDSGVQSIQNFTWSVAPGSGTWNLFAYRILAKVELQNYAGAQRGSKSFYRNAMQLGFPRIYNGSVLFFMWNGDYGSINPNINNPQISGCVEFAQG